jgi:hypothetical protein
MSDAQWMMAYIAASLGCVLVYHAGLRSEGPLPCDMTAGQHFSCLLLSAVWPIGLPIAVITIVGPFMMKERTFKRKEAKA